MVEREVTVNDEDQNSNALRSWLIACAVVPAIFALTWLFAGLPGQLTSPPRFWLGMLHGFVAPCSFIASLFADVRMYDPTNVTRWYDCGFLLGALQGLLQFIPEPAQSPEARRIQDTNRFIRKLRAASPWNR